MADQEERLAEVPGLIADLYVIVDRLEELFPGRSFTPDGHLVGSIGESLAAYMFDLTLMPASNEAYDALASDGRSVEIKATQRAGVALSANAAPDHLIILRLPRGSRHHRLPLGRRPAPGPSVPGHRPRRGRAGLSLGTQHC